MDVHAYTSPYAIAKTSPPDETIDEAFVIIARSYAKGSDAPPPGTMLRLGRVCLAAKSSDEYGPDVFAYSWSMFANFVTRGVPDLEAAPPLRVSITLPVSEYLKDDAVDSQLVVNVSCQDTFMYALGVLRHLILVGRFRWNHTMPVAVCDSTVRAKPKLDGRQALTVARRGSGSRLFPGIHESGIPKTRCLFGMAQDCLLTGHQLARLEELLWCALENGDLLLHVPEATMEDAGALAMPLIAVQRTVCLMQDDLASNAKGHAARGGIGDDLPHGCALTQRAGIACVCSPDGTVESLWKRVLAEGHTVIVCEDELVGGYRDLLKKSFKAVVNLDDAGKKTCSFIRAFEAADDFSLTPISGTGASQDGKSLLCNVGRRHNDPLRVSEAAGGSWAGTHLPQDVLHSCPDVRDIFPLGVEYVKPDQSKQSPNATGAAEISSSTVVLLPESVLDAAAAAAAGDLSFIFPVTAKVGGGVDQTERHLALQCKFILPMRTRLIVFHGSGLVGRKTSGAAVGWATAQSMICHDGGEQPLVLCLDTDKNTGPSKRPASTVPAEGPATKVARTDPSQASNTRTDDQPVRKINQRTFQVSGLGADVIHAQWLKDMKPILNDSGISWSNVIGPMRTIMAAPEFERIINLEFVPFANGSKTIPLTGDALAGKLDENARGIYNKNVSNGSRPDMTQTGWDRAKDSREFFSVPLIRRVTNVLGWCSIGSANGVDKAADEPLHVLISCPTTFSAIFLEYMFRYHFADAVCPYLLTKDWPAPHLRAAVVESWASTARDLNEKAKLSPDANSWRVLVGIVDGNIDAAGLGDISFASVGITIGYSANINSLFHYANPTMAVGHGSVTTLQRIEVRGNPAFNLMRSWSHLIKLPPKQREGID